MVAPGARSGKSGCHIPSHFDGENKKMTTVAVDNYMRCIMACRRRKCRIRGEEEISNCHCCGICMFMYKLGLLYE